MQRGSFFVKEHVLANMSFGVMRRWKCLPVRVGIEYKQYCTHHFIEKGMFLQYVFKQSALCLIACLISSQQRMANTAEQQVLLVQSTVVAAPKRKNQGALNLALRIATTEWGLTAQIISSAYINRWSVGSSTWRVHLDTQRITRERHVSEYMFLNKKWTSLHGLSSLSFSRRGPVTH